MATAPPPGVWSNYVAQLDKRNPLSELHRQYLEGRLTIAELERFGASRQEIEHIKSGQAKPGTGFLQSAAGAVGGAASSVGGAAESAANAVGSAAQAVANTPEELVKGAVEIVEPIALKGTLTLLFVLAGIGLSLYGFLEMVKPGSPGRLLKDTFPASPSKAAKAAEAAGALA